MLVFTHLFYHWLCLADFMEFLSCLYKWLSPRTGFYQFGQVIMTHPWYICSIFLLNYPRNSTTTKIGIKTYIRKERKKAVLRIVLFLVGKIQEEMPLNITQREGMVLLRKQMGSHLFNI